MGRCNAGHPNAFSRNGTHGIDYIILTHKLQCKDESWRTYAAFAHPHRLCAPFIVNGTFELQEPRMRQISQPPISRMLYCDLSKHTFILRIAARKTKPSP